MSFIDVIAPTVPEATQRAGRLLFNQGRFTCDLDSPEYDIVVKFNKPESATASVFVERKNRLLIRCDCDAFQRSLDTCRHLWATYLLGQEKGAITIPDKVRSIQLLLDEDFEDEDDGDYHDDFDDFDDRPNMFQMMPHNTQGTSANRGKRPGWKSVLENVREAQRPRPYGYSSWPPSRQFVYVLDLDSSNQGKGLVVRIGYRERKLNGEWKKTRFQRFQQSVLEQCPDPRDREVLTTLMGAIQHADNYYGYHYYASSDIPMQFTLRSPVERTLRLLCSTGRCFYQGPGDSEPVGPIHWEDPAWELWLNVEEAGSKYHLTGQLRRGEERAAFADARMISQQGFVVWPDHLTGLDLGSMASWIPHLVSQPVISIPKKEADKLTEQLLALPKMPRVDLPSELHFEQVDGSPRPCLVIKAPQGNRWQTRLSGHLSFDYEGQIIAVDDARGGVFDRDNRKYIRRDSSQEKAHLARLLEIGFRESYRYGQVRDLELTPRHLSRVVSTLLAEGWAVEAEGKMYRSGGTFNIQVQSGIDWFELHGQADFEGKQVSLPKLLEAIRKGETTVPLGDGTFGMLPEEWLKRYGLLAGLGTKEGDHVRFAPSQVGLLDALLATQPEVKIDEKFARIRDELNSFAGVQPEEPSEGFQGTLRPYQKEGLGWLNFLRKFSFGGCLADDMGLGKTIQVLALLEAHREASAGKKKKTPTSLIVVPRSLVFNWKEEAKRFTPKLRVLDQTGLDRDRDTARFKDFDVVLITYGTLRRDILKLKEYPFEYCILDEAQAIKNSSSQGAKAARLIQARHRLALSGTPVENHLGELWSIFEFLNPGMLGAARVFKEMVGKQSSEAGRRVLAKALRPFLLRRTKEEVVTDLPPKTEQTIYCELDRAQRKEYDELREYYRQSLLAKVQAEGMNKAKIQVLEALLRLRQAACHPGLISKKKQDGSSAKLDVLLPQIRELVDEGHKVLVFSQFVQFLSIVRKHLNAEKIRYAYLDGQTRKRQEQVDEFQSDPDCKLFLISLKAGGLGLNLTAAEYVILLDPWWNPAVESQAIDRAHRIGQTQPVFAYRIIARDTVEEKVLQLQQSKRELADAIINADNAIISNLSSDDLELLLS